MKVVAVLVVVDQEEVAVVRKARDSRVFFMYVLKERRTMCYTIRKYLLGDYAVCWELDKGLLLIYIR